MTTQDVFQNFAVRTRVGFTGVTQRQQGATLIMMNAQTIKCTRESFEGDRDTQVIQFGVIAAHSEGVARAPFKYNDQRRPADRPQTKPLTAMSADGGIQFWSWPKKGQDKGERLDDVTWTLHPGTTLKVFLRNDDMGKIVDTKGRFTEIPAFSLCEVQLVPKSSEPCDQGWGLNVRSIAPTALSVYSYLPALKNLPTSAEDAKLRAIQSGDSSPQMHRQIEGDSAFFAQVQVGLDAYTEHVPAKEVQGKNGTRTQPAFVRFWNCIPGNPTCVDIPEEQLLSYTNTTSVESALRLIEVASALGCVSMVINSNEFRGKREDLSHLVGVPVIDTDKLLSAVNPEAAVDESNQLFCAAASITHFTGTDQALWLAVQDEEDNGACSAVQQTSDLILCETIEQCGRGVPIAFVLSEDKTVLWRGYMNTSPVQMLCAGGSSRPVRRKWDSM